VTFVPPDDPGTGPSGASADPWAGVREELAADVRRVSGRLRSLSATRLAGAPGPSVDPVDHLEGEPAYASRAEAGRAAATALARAAAALEAASGEPAAGEVSGRPAAWGQPPDLPVLSDLAVGDQVAVTGHDLLAAMDGVPPGAPVWSGSPVRTSTDGTRTAEQAVRAAARVLTDVRRRL
jgi:hypothetical protein